MLYTNIIFYKRLEYHCLMVFVGVLIQRNRCSLYTVVVLVTRGLLTASFRVLVYGHHEENQTGMVLEQYLKVLHLDLQAASRESDTGHGVGF